MKNLIWLLVIASTCSCTSVIKIGTVNMISNRNVNPKLEYDVISTYAGGSNRELKKARTETVEDAINNTVKKVPGGEFLMNVKIYLVNKKYIAVEGDVWGVKTNLAYRGLKVGDKVVWKAAGNYKNGTIKALKDDKTCLIECTDGDIVEKKYDEVSKAE